MPVKIDLVSDLHPFRFIVWHVDASIGPECYYRSARRTFEVPTRAVQTLALGLPILLLCIADRANKTSLG